MEKGVEWPAESGSSLLWGDDFSVDDLLNLGFKENEAATEEEDEVKAVEQEEGEIKSAVGGYPWADSSGESQALYLALRLREKVLNFALFLLAFRRTGV